MSTTSRHVRGHEKTLPRRCSQERDSRMLPCTCASPRRACFTTTSWTRGCGSITPSVEVITPREKGLQASVIAHSFPTFTNCHGSPAMTNGGVFSKPHEPNRYAIASCCCWHIKEPCDQKNCSCSQRATLILLTGR